MLRWFEMRPVWGANFQALDFIDRPVGPKPLIPLGQARVQAGITAQLRNSACATSQNGTSRERSGSSESLLRIACTAQGKLEGFGAYSGIGCVRPVPISAVKSACGSVPPFSP